MSESGKAEPQSQPSPSDAPTDPTTPAIDDAPKKADRVEQHDFANPTLGIIGNASRRTSYSGAAAAPATAARRAHLLLAASVFALDSTAAVAAAAGLESHHTAVCDEHAGLRQRLA
jgi:hypothetical protein